MRLGRGLSPIGSCNREKYLGTDAGGFAWYVRKCKCKSTLEREVGKNIFRIRVSTSVCTCQVLIAEHT